MCLPPQPPAVEEGLRLLSSVSCRFVAGRAGFCTLRSFSFSCFSFFHPQSTIHTRADAADHTHTMYWCTCKIVSKGVVSRTLSNDISRQLTADSRTADRHAELTYVLRLSDLVCILLVAEFFSVTLLLFSCRSLWGASHAADQGC